MTLFLRLAFVLLAFSSCKSSASLTEPGQTAEVSIEKYQVLVQFENPEGLKRMLFRLDQYQLELIKEVATSNFLFLLQLNAKPYEINGIVEKMGLDSDVTWARKVVE